MELIKLLKVILEEISLSTGDELEELADSFNIMQYKISDLIGKVQSSIIDVSDSAINISEMSNDVALAIGEVANTAGGDIKRYNGICREFDKCYLVI